MDKNRLKKIKYELSTYIISGWTIDGIGERLLHELYNEIDRLQQDNKELQEELNKWLAEFNF
jgi:hypothetical protein